MPSRDPLILLMVLHQLRVQYLDSQLRRHADLGGLLLECSARDEWKLRLGAAGEAPPPKKQKVTGVVAAGTRCASRTRASPGAGTWTLYPGTAGTS